MRSMLCRRSSVLWAPASRVVQSRRLFKLPEPLGSAEAKKYYSERRKLGYPLEKAYAIAADVTRYPEFVPWCTGTKILRTIGSCRADVELTVGFPPIVQSYVSEVTFVPPTLVRSVSSDSNLFKQLISQWRFYVAEEDPSDTCTLSFSVVFEFQSNLYAAVANLFFEQVSQKMINAFMERAKTLYGEPATLKQKPQ